MTETTILAFFTEHVPNDWFDGELTITTDDDEILCVGSLPAGSDVVAFREASRESRMSIAAGAEAQYRRRVSWGVTVDGRTTVFTSQSAPVMTRLRLRERAVLDTLVKGGVARSRSDALAWCVKLVARHEADWLADLQEVLAGVDTVRREGPTLV